MRFEDTVKITSSARDHHVPLVSGFNFPFDMLAEAVHFLRLPEDRCLTYGLDGKADVVYGSRFMGGEPHRVLYFWHYLGNRFLTLLSNMFTNLNLTDMETCYKVFRLEILRSISLEEKRFGFEPEITAKIARTGCRIFEVGISYTGRTYSEGKKINWKDGVRALWCIGKYSTWRRKIG